MSHKCNQCDRSFKTEQGLRDHTRDVHTKLADHPEVGKEGAKAVLADIGDDLPDGAFWALAEDLGLDADDF